jgi:hypothetical protein
MIGILIREYRKYQKRRSEDPIVIELKKILINTVF